MTRHGRERDETCRLVSLWWPRSIVYDDSVLEGEREWTPRVYVIMTDDGTVVFIGRAECV